MAASTSSVWRAMCPCVPIWLCFITSKAVETKVWVSFSWPVSMLKRWHKRLTSFLASASFSQLDNLQANEDIHPDLIITEDSNSGYEFYHKLFGETCCSAEGKSNILSYLQKSHEKEILAIVDGAAFGPEMQHVMQYIRDSRNKIVLYAPESFEYLLLRANIIDRTSEATEKTYELADSREYFSWEEFYTAYLIEQTRNTIYEYSKKKLKDTYLTTGNFRKIVSQLPEKIKLALMVNQKQQL